MRKIILLIVFISALNFLFAEWTILETISIPEGASGLAWDGTYLYCGIYGVDGDHIYKIDPADGSAQLLFSDPDLDDTYGLTWDGNHLWLTDHRNGTYEPAVAYEYDLDGNILSEITLPDHYMSGIAYDNGDFWVSTYYDPDGEIYKIDAQGTILQQFAAPDNQPWDLCLENDNLWMADYWGDTLYKIDPVTGSLLESYPSEGVDPAGIVFDGQYLWYCDNGQGGSDYLYKVDLGGVGTPAISLDWDEYDFGNVIVNESASVDLPVTNTGNAQLEITQVSFTSQFYSAIFQPPVIIPAGDTGYISITFSPDTWGEDSAQLTIGSNDPVNPEVYLSFSGYGIFADQEIETDQISLQYEGVRVGAVTGQFLNISNQGNEQLIIDDLQFVTDLYYIDETLQLPVTINTRESYPLRIWFSPESSGDSDDILAIFSNDSDENPLTVQLQGTAIEQSYPITNIFWEYTIDTSWDNSPKAMIPVEDISGDGISDLVVCSEDGYVRSFNSNSSNLADILWEYELPAGYVYSQKGLLSGFDADDDSFNDIVVGTAGGDKAVRMISGKTGDLIWEYNTNEYGDGGWVYQVDWLYDYNMDLFPDVLACAGDDANDMGPKRVFCLNGLTGDVIWNYPVGGPVFSVIGIDDINYDGINDVLAGASNQSETEGKIIALDGNSGSFIWEYTTSGSSVWGLAKVDDFTSDGTADVVAGDFYGTYYGLDAINGEIEWSGSIGNYVLITQFEILNDVNGDQHPDILIANSDNNAKVIDGFSGGYIWDQYLGDNSLSVDRIPDINGDLVNDVLVGSLNNFCYFLNGINGEQLGSYNLGTPVDAITAIPDINGDLSWEMVAGGRSGLIKCLSGGLDAIVNADEDELPDNNHNISINNYPNPFNPTTTINFSLNTENCENMEIVVYNLKGQKIKKYPLSSEYIETISLSKVGGTVVWDGTDSRGIPVASGIYFAEVKADNKSAVAKMVLLK